MHNGRSQNNAWQQPSQRKIYKYFKCLIRTSLGRLEQSQTLSAMCTLGPDQWLCIKTAILKFSQEESNSRIDMSCDIYSKPFLGETWKLPLQTSYSADKSNLAIIDHLASMLWHQTQNKHADKSSDFIPTFLIYNFFFFLSQAKVGCLNLHNRLGECSICPNVSTLRT